ncbi:MAG: transporter substrate-binding domain-containing protein [Spirochaetes bacterium]|nr:transporter substrate-binding domain-containing protein [Spirochaetota bacterium]
MRKVLTVAVILLLTSMLFAQSVIQIRVTHYPPQYYKDSKGNWTGLDVELAAALCKEAGLKYEFVHLPWSRALSDLESGNLHMMMNLSITDERSQFIQWIGPERINKMVIIVKKNNKRLKISSLDDMIQISKQFGKKWGIQADVHYSDEFSKKMENDSNFSSYFEEVSKADLNVTKTQKDRILGFIEEQVPMVYKIKNDPAFSGLVTHSFVIGEEKVYFGISKKISPSVFKKLKEAYDKLVRKKTLEKIQKKYTNL